MVRKNAILHPYSMFNEVRHPDRLQRGMAHILERLLDGRLKPRINDRIFTMSDAIEAYRYMLAGEQVGKIVVKVSD
ncbi:MAG: zinc-binding dehydrogenase [Parasphingorhabdus sp.]